MTLTSDGVWNMVEQNMPKRCEETLARNPTGHAAWPRRRRLRISKWLEIFFYNFTFSYNFFGPPQLAEFRNAMPLQATGNHFWSICAEEQFYLFAPFLITIPARIGRTIWFWCLICAAALASPYWGYFASISFGVLASVIRLRLGDWHTAKPATVILAVVAVISFLGIICTDVVPL
jgi:peptidoglycan/LPS O-acetylase OafA/YrhL